MAKLIIMQGIPGSGKSRVARKLAKRLGASIVSADDLPGLYAADGFHPELLGEAHKRCFRLAVEHARAGHSVIVDNTNLTALEMAPYIALGAAYGYGVQIVRVRCPQPVAYARQTHGVPLAVHRGMARRLREFQMPPYWDVTIREV